MREEPERAQRMPKRVIKVYLSSQQLEMLKFVCSKLGRDYSGFFEDLFMRYCETINLVRERVHRG